MCTSAHTFVAEHRIHVCFDHYSSVVVHHSDRTHACTNTKFSTVDENLDRVPVRGCMMYCPHKLYSQWRNHWAGARLGRDVRRAANVRRTDKRRISGNVREAPVGTTQIFGSLYAPGWVVGASYGVLPMAADPQVLLAFKNALTCSILNLISWYIGHSLAVFPKSTGVSRYCPDTCTGRLILRITNASQNLASVYAYFFEGRSTVPTSTKFIFI
eukprot:SAG11_NODE_4604_length_1838_cov_1.763657_1_plen_214_part_00